MHTDVSSEISQHRHWHLKNEISNILESAKRQVIGTQETIDSCFRHCQPLVLDRLREGLEVRNGDNEAFDRSEVVAAREERVFVSSSRTSRDRDYDRKSYN